MITGEIMPYPPQVKQFYTLPDVRRLCEMIAEHNVPQPMRNPMPDGKKHPSYFEFVLDDDADRPSGHFEPWSFDPEPRGKPEHKRYQSPPMKITMMLHFAVCVGPFTPEA